MREIQAAPGTAYAAPWALLADGPRPIAGGARYRESRAVILRAGCWPLLVYGPQPIAVDARYRKSRAVIICADRWALLVDWARPIADGARDWDDRAVISMMRRPLDDDGRRGATDRRRR